MVKRRRVTSVDKGEKDRVENGSVTDANNDAVDQKRQRSTSSSAACCDPADGGRVEGQEGTTKDGLEAVDEKEACPQPTRTSSRVPKRPRRDSSPPPSPPKKPAKVEVKTGTPETKTRRQWEQWSTEDKDTFFEGLYEHGKDFEAIQALIVARHRKRGNAMSVIKTKEQVRYFYYRTWHKISKFIDLTEDVSKQTLELYGLINYGELRKRVGGMLNEKSGQKLNDLVHKGSTVVKVKGKNYRLRTPVCRALKKLNNIEDAKEEAEPVKVPKLLTVELRPASNGAWSTVQAIAHNPRLRIHLPSNKRLSSIISFLDSKWKSSRLRANQKEAMNVSEDSKRTLKLLPPPGCDLFPFDIEPTTVAPSVNLALGNLKDNLKDKQDTCTSPALKRARKNVEDHHSEDSGHSLAESLAMTENTQPCQANGNTEVRQFSGITAGESAKDKDIVGKMNAAGSKIDSAGATRVPNGCTLGAANQAAGRAASDVTMEKLTCKTSDIQVSQETVILEKTQTTNETDTNQGDVTDPKDDAMAKEAAKKERLVKLQEGWTKEQAQGLTIAEVYLMLGCPEKLTLEYDWVDKVKNDNVLQMNLTLTNMLRRLVQLATTEFADFSKCKPQSLSLRTNSPPRTCTCGAQSAGTPPNRSSVKSPRIVSGVNQASKSPSTPKNPNKPGSATTPKTPGTRQGTPATTKQPEQSESATLGSSQVAATGSASDAVFRVPNPVPIRPQVIRISPSSLAERSFLQQIDTVNKQPDIYLPRRQKKIMRNVRRPLVVQRTLLPKTGVPTRQIMTLAMLPNQSQLAQTGSFMPVVPGQPLGPNGQPQHIIGQIRSQVAPLGVVSMAAPPTTTSEKTGIPSTSVPAVSVQLPVTTNSSLEASKTSSGNSLLSRATAASGINMSMSEISMSEAPQTGDGSMSSILDIAIPGMAEDKMLGVSSFSGLLDTTSGSGADMLADKVTNDDSMPLPPSAHSPNKTYRLVSTLPPDMQWMGGDDFSLSQFLSDSPLKKSSDVSLLCENSRDSIRMDVDSALQSMMNENSMDYVAKFADLAAQIASNGPEPQVKGRELATQ